MKPRVGALVVGFSVGMLCVAWLRLQADSPGIAGALSGYATVVYVGVTIVAAVLLIRAGVPVRDLGFEQRSKVALYVALAIAGVVLVQLGGSFVEPVWEQIFGSGRNLTRFSDVGGSMSNLVKVLLLSWTVAAFGEEIAFRILLMRSIAYALGDSRFALATALVGQAIVFGLVHAYQGPAGIVGATSTGLIYGALTLAARGSIWPAALAHGINNSTGLLSIYLRG